MEKKISRRAIFQFRRNRTAEWEANKNVIPAEGEPCYDLELRILKIGDGITTYENLKPIGGVDVDISADGKSVVLENDIFKLAGFDAAKTGAQPRKNADGRLEWVVPSTDTVEGLQTTVAGLQSDVANLQEIIGTSGDGNDTLISKISGLEHAVNTLNGVSTVEGSVKKIVTDELNAFATNITDDGVVNSYKELIDYVAEHDGEAANMASDISTLQGLVGATSVQAQIEAALGNMSGKIDGVAVNGTLLDIVDKQVNIPLGAGLKASQGITIEEDGTLNIGVVSFDNIVQGEQDLVLDGGGASV